MPLHNITGAGGPLAYSKLASHPLPGPAVVIDVRKTTSYDPPLAWHLRAELEDLTTQMRLHGVKRWRFLSECIEFVTLDPLPPDRTINTATSFTLIRGNGEVQSFLTKDDLVNHLYKEYIDLVRTNRISAARDTNQSVTSFRVSEVELERPTVRVFFLADMADPDSLTHATNYAALLRKKSEEYDNNPLRSGRDESINPIVICMNADRLYTYQPDTQPHPGTAAAPPPIVVPDENSAVPAYRAATHYDELLTPQVSTTFDMIILLHAYRDDEGFVGGDAQIYELELILYTLLLAPESLGTLSREIKDEYADLYLTDLHEEQPHLPRSELCMLGIASLEYSASWARRWLNYGLVKRLLQTLREMNTGEDERNLRLPDGRDWLDAWWAEVRSVLPRILVATIPGAKGLSEFQRRITTSPFQGVPLRHSLHVLEQFCQDLGRYYTGSGATLQQAAQSAEQVISLLNEPSRKVQQDNFLQEFAGKEQLKELQELQKQANLFSVSLFKGAVGALPRAISQLSELEGRIEGGDIGRNAHHTPNFARLHERFEEQARKAQERLAATLHIWQVPLVGRMLRSTFLSLCLVLLLAIGAWFLQNSLSFLPSALTYSLPEPDGISLFRVFVLFLLALAESFYLFRRNQRLREQRNSVLRELCQTAIVHLTEVQLSIAATIALRLIQEAGLYHPKGKASQYKQRLRALDKVLKEAQEQALFDHRGAYDRLKLALSPMQTGTLSTSAWLNLNTRKDLLPWEKTIETFQRLGKELLQNKNLDILAESLLRQLATEKQLATKNTIASSVNPSSTGQEQLQAISTELVATLLVTEVTGSSIVTLHPLLERYISLEQRQQYVPSLLGESIVEFYDAIKAIKLEQSMNSDMGISSSYEALEGFIMKTKKPVEQMLLAWVENLCQSDEQVSRLISSSNIVARLQEFQIKISDVLEDLRRRCKLLGYRSELMNSSDAYMLLVSSPDNSALQEALANSRSNQIRLVQFPDEDKLIYLHTYRVSIRS